MSSIASVSSATNLYQTTAPTSSGQYIKDFQALGTALQSGDLASAQSALSTFQQQLQTDLKTTQTPSKTHKGHHHHHGASAAGTTSSSITPTSTTAATSTKTSATNGSGGILDVSA